MLNSAIASLDHVDLELSPISTLLDEITEFVLSDGL
jgi:hypothetical protein